MASSYDDDVDHKIAHISISGEKEISEDAHIYLRAEKYGGGLCNWYVIKNWEDTRHKSVGELEYLSPVFNDTMEFKCSSACVAMGSLIYVLGGYRERPIPKSKMPVIRKPPEVTNEVFYMDTLRPENGWTRAPSMVGRRASIYAFTLDGGIYALGKIYLDTNPKPSNYAEVFFPSEENSSWQPVFQNIPEVISNGGRVFAHQITVTNKQKRQLLVQSIASGLGLVHSYDFDQKTWVSCCDGDFGPERSTCVIILDDIMYCYDCRLNDGKFPRFPDALIMGFDVKNPKSPPKPLRFSDDEEKELPRPDYIGHYPRGDFLHLGNAKLCLVLQDYFYPQGLMVTCLKFNVSKARNLSGEVDLVASQLCKWSFFLKASCLNNLIAVPAFGARKAEDIRCKPSDARTASPPATINDRNKEVSDNATVNAKRMKGKRKKKNGNGRKN